MVHAATHLEVGFSREHGHCPADAKKLLPFYGSEPRHPDSFYGLTALLIAVYGIALLRAWQLLGARRYGLLGWLSPLHESNEQKPISTAEQSPESSNKPPGAN